MQIDLDLTERHASWYGWYALAGGVLTPAVDCTGLTRVNGYLVCDLKCDHPEYWLSSSWIELTSSGVCDFEEWSFSMPVPTTDWATYIIPLQPGGDEGLNVSAINYIRMVAVGSTELTFDIKNVKIQFSPDNAIFFGMNF